MKLLTTIQAAAQLQLSPRTLERWRLERRGPPYRKFGSCVRYELADLATWAQTQADAPRRGEQ